MKRCKKCGDEKPLEEFYACKGTKDGHTGTCKKCKREYQKERPAKIKKDIERRRDQKPERRKFLYENLCRWRRENPEKARAQVLRYKEKYIARNILNAAIRDGKIQKQPCAVCGETRVQAHHEDYSKPLEVVWLCAKCHRTEHESIPF